MQSASDLPQTAPNQTLRDRLSEGLSKQPKSILVRYLLPVIGIAASVLVTFVLSLVLPKGYDFPNVLLFLVAIFVAAWFGGYGPGAIDCVLTMALPMLGQREFRLANLDFGRLGLLIAISLLVSWVANTQRRKKEMLWQANDELDKRVRSRTEDLARAVQALESEVEQHKKTEKRLQTQLERLSLLDQITRAIAERLDLRSIFQVVVRTLEDSLPVDFACVCLHDSAAEVLTVTCVGANSEALAMELAMTQQSRVEIDPNGLSRCVRGQLVYEPDLKVVDFPFPQRLLRGGLQSVVAAPLLFESKVFGVLIASRRQANGFASGDCEFLRQLSEHVALAAHQAQVYAALEQAYQDLRQTQQTVMQQERLRALGQMASGIAHDINNAVSPVALYTESLLETEPNLSPRTREYLETTQRAIEDVAQTVARMREFYRQQEPQLELVSVDLSRLAQQVLDLTRVRWNDMPQQRGKMIQLKTELSPQLPTVAGSESEIREALINLVFNAVDAMPDGGTLTVRTKASKSSRHTAGPPEVHLEVADTGIGMDEATRRRCLEPFFTTKGERGTGLGLAMVYGIAQRHNAEIEIESTAGKGTTVRLNFPASLAQGIAEDQAQAATPATARLRLLVVDDDPLLTKSLRDTLEADGHSVVIASGGQEGIDTFTAAERSGERFAAVITDLGMPYVDGRKVASAVKAASPTKPVIMLTGWGQRLVAEGDIPPHVDRVLNKPPKLRELRSALAELVAAAR
jgi:signal transduction histidine kinase/ActR/RegA family two-component response regulator